MKSSWTVIRITSVIIAILLALLAVVLVLTLVDASTATENMIPLVYYKGSNPTITPSPIVPKPTPTRDPSLWMCLLRSVNVGGENITYAQVAGVQWEMWGEKIDKTIYVKQYCPRVNDQPLVCNIWEAPPACPADCNWETGQWCEVEKLVFPQNAQRVCSLNYPYQCITVK